MAYQSLQKFVSTDALRRTVPSADHFLKAHYLQADNVLIFKNRFQNHFKSLTLRRLLAFLLFNFVCENLVELQSLD